MNIGYHSKIDMGCYFLEPRKIEIGNHVHINRRCLLDGRGEISIGDNVSISHNVKLMTADHNVQSSDFSYQTGKIIIQDHVFIGVNAMVLKGVTLGKGAVVCAGAVVVKDVDPFTIVAGCPAKKIGDRTKNLTYKPLEGFYHTPSFA